MRAAQTALFKLHWLFLCSHQKMDDSRNFAIAFATLEPSRRPFPLDLLHLGLCISIFLEESLCDHLVGCLMHLVPSMKAAALAQRAHPVWKGVMEIMEKHFIPAMPPSQDHRHNKCTAARGASTCVFSKEFVPPM